jgi:hypothetical protein
MVSSVVQDVTGLHGRYEMRSWTAAVMLCLPGASPPAWRTDTSATSPNSQRSS